MKPKVIILTTKQADALISAVRSTAELRSTEKERSYLRQLLKKLREQTT